MHTQAVFIVTEEHFYNSMKIIERELNRREIEVLLFFLPELSNRDILWRFKNRNSFFDNIKLHLSLKVKDFKENCIVVFSTGEGFEIGNLDRWLPKELKSKKSIVIQHGIFGESEMELEKKNIVKITRKLVNTVTSRLFNFNLLGKGFGGVKFDYYIVYAEKYKNFLCEYRNWKVEEIIVSGRLLKGGVNEPIENKLKSTDTCLFLLQNLVFAKIIEESKYLYYLSSITSQLVKCFKSVRVRFHPKMERKNYEPIFDYPSVTITSGTSLKEDLEDVNIAFSFHSTALIDAFLYGVPVVGVKIPEIKEIDYKFLSTTVTYKKILKFTQETKNFNECKITRHELEFENNKEESLQRILACN